MSIVRTDIPTTAQLCDDTVLALTRRYPTLTTELLTLTAYGRPIRALNLGTGERKVLFTAAHHANEWITAPILLKFAEDLALAAEEGSALGGVDAKTLLQQVSIYTVPMVDPDGVALVTKELLPEDPGYAAAREIAESFPAIPFPDGWKANLSGTDLNLNYPAGWLRAREIKFSQGYDRPAPRDYVGRAPLDQPETRTLAAYTEYVDPALVLAFHSQGQVIYWQFDDIFVPGAEELGKQLAQASGYALEDTPYNSAFAGYKDWFIQTFRRPGYTVEVGLGENPLPLDQFDTIYRENLPLLLRAAQG